MCKNINNFLRKGGLFIGTTMNRDKVLKLLGKDKIVERYDDKGGLLFSIEFIKKDVIKVFIRTINTPREEYLINFSSFDKELAKYGIFEPSKETL